MFEIRIKIKVTASMSGLFLSDIYFDYFNMKNEWSNMKNELENMKNEKVNIELKNAENYNKNISEMKTLPEKQIEETISIHKSEIVDLKSNYDMQLEKQNQECKKDYEMQMEQLKTKLTYSFVKEIHELKMSFTEMDKLIKKLKLKSEIVHINYSSGFQGRSFNANILNYRDLNTAVLTENKGWLVVQFKDTILLDCIEIGGYTGEQGWSTRIGYGAGGNLAISVDSVSWEEVAKIPSGFGSEIIDINFTLSLAKYLRFESNDWLAIGFVGVKC